MPRESRNPPPFNPLSMPTILPDGRVFIPTGKPVVHSVGGEIITKIDRNPWDRQDFPSYAQVFIGLSSSRAGKKYTPKQVQDEFIRLRSPQVGISNVGASFVSQGGLYEGLPERSSQILIMFFPSEDEASFKKFMKNILKISEIMTESFVQDTIYVNFYKEGAAHKSYKVYSLKKK